MKHDHHYFCNNECEYFPCHDINNTDTPFNCLFCYCPLYNLGNECGGNFIYTDNGIKDCSKCLYPHNPDNYDKIIDKLSVCRKSNF